MPNKYYRETPGEIHDRLRNTIEKAIHDSELMIHYQPKVDIYTGDIKGVESLVRWVKEGKLYLSPDEFIPLFEKKGLIDIIDFYMLECAIEKLKKWECAGRKLIPIAVNVCKQTLLREDFFEKLSQMDEKHQYCAYIEIEVTERDIPLEDMKAIGHVVDQLREVGYGVAVDDFGAGSANLILLSSLDIYTLKIDKSIIDHLRDNPKVEAILESMIKICDTLGIEVVPEGIEEGEQVEVLKRLNCVMAQGFYFSPPVEEARLLPQYKISQEGDQND